MIFRVILPLLLASGVFAQSSTPGPTVRFRTNLGDIDVQLLPGSAPRTVENFMRYVNRKAYDNSVFHRSVRNFIIQGGGFQASLPNLPAIPADPPVINEFRESNVRGTLAMAKLEGDPNSATNQWFFNLNNANAANLDNQNGGFTVFGRIVDNASLAVLDRLAAVPVPSPGPFPSPFNEIPLQNYTSGATVQAANLLIVQSITELPTAPPPAISQGGIVSASAFGGYNYAAPGSYLEIFGDNLAVGTMDWASSFTGANAPTQLDGVSVTVGGQRAFISFVSPTQVNVQVPSTVAIGQNLPVVLTNRGQSTSAVSFPIRLLAGGLLAPASFRVGGRQYVYATKGNSSTIVSNGSIPGLPAAPATPGEVLVMYGTGFGAMVPFTIPVAGSIPSTVGTRLQFPVTIRIGGIAAQVLYEGVIPGFVGLYQFNVVVPPDAPDGDLPLEIVQNNSAVPQNLFLPVRR